ncbi:MAG: hypothetical protein ACK58L_03040 [Planctomycetota bacterium]
MIETSDNYGARITVCKPIPQQPARLTKISAYAIRQTVPASRDIDLRAHVILHKQGQKNTVLLCNTVFFRTRLDFLIKSWRKSPESRPEFNKNNDQGLSGMSLELQLSHDTCTIKLRDLTRIRTNDCLQPSAALLTVLFVVRKTHADEM